MKGVLFLYLVINLREGKTCSQQIILVFEESFEGEFVDRFTSNGIDPDLRLLTQNDDSPAPPLSGPQAVVNLAHFRLAVVGFFLQQHQN